LAIWTPGTRGGPALPMLWGRRPCCRSRNPITRGVLSGNGTLFFFFRFSVWKACGNSWKGGKKPKAKTGGTFRGGSFVVFGKHGNSRPFHRPCRGPGRRGSRHG
jgi:hypothetical protein